MAFYQDLDLLRFFIRIAECQHCTRSNVQGLPIRVLWPHPHSHHTWTQPPECSLTKDTWKFKVKTLSFPVPKHNFYHYASWLRLSSSRQISQADFFRKLDCHQTLLTPASPGLRTTQGLIQLLHTIAMPPQHLPSSHKSLVR